jgi:hypothetical protein
MVAYIPLISPIINLIESFLHQTLKLALFLSLIFASLHRLGVLQRIIHRLAEDALSNVRECCTGLILLLMLEKKKKKTHTHNTLIFPSIIKYAFHVISYLNSC